MASQEQIVFSVIIPALNEERMIGRCLDSLAKIDFPKNRFEVIVVDNGSTDRTIEIARSYSATLDLRVLQKTGCCIAGLRNYGVRQSRGTYLAFIDADMLVPAGWLSNAQAYLAAHPASVIGALFEVPPDASWVGRTWHRSRLGTKSQRVSFIATGNLITSRVNFERVGGFDETLETNEDCDFSHRATAAGLSLALVPEIATVHLGIPETLADFYRSERWRGRNVLKVFLRDPLSRLNARAVALALYTALSLIGLLLSVLFSLPLGQVWPIAVFAVAIVVPPVLLAARASYLHRRAALFFPLSALLLVFGVARAMCLLKVEGWSVRRSAPQPGRNPLAP